MTAPMDEPLPSGDLSPLFRQPRQPTTRFGQGRLLSWNPETFESIVQWHGARLVNPPVLAGMDALTFRAGMDVLLIGWDGGGRRGAQDWAILSRAIEPGPDAAEEAIAPMRTRLAQQIAAEVFAARIRVAVADGQVSTTSDDWVELSGGPEIADVEVSETGIAIVFISANVFGMADLTESGVAGLMSVKVSGATVVAPLNRWQFGGRSVVLPGNENTVNMLAAGTRVAVFNELNPGLHTFTAVYQTATGFPEVNFNGRSLSVIAL